MRVRIPSYQHRRLKAPKPPLAVVSSYQELLRRFFTQLQTGLENRFLEGWERNPVHFSGGVTADASTYIRKRLGGAELALQEVIKPGSQLSQDIRILAARVSKKGDVEFRRVIGIPHRELGTGAALDHFRDHNVSLIKSLAGQQLDEITELLSNAETSGLRVEAIREQIQKRFSVTKSKADLLARDQVLKLNGSLTKVRQEGVGITHYIWTTSHDERVRGTPGGKWPKGLHYELDGTPHPWAVPPVSALDGARNHPGEDFQCRCTAFPILPELLSPEPTEVPADLDDPTDGE